MKMPFFFSLPLLYPIHSTKLFWYFFSLLVLKQILETPSPNPGFLPFTTVTKIFYHIFCNLRGRGWEISPLHRASLAIWLKPNLEISLVKMVMGYPWNVGGGLFAINHKLPICHYFLSTMKNIKCIIYQYFYSLQYQHKIRNYLRNIICNYEGNIYDYIKCKYLSNPWLW